MMKRLKDYVSFIKIASTVFVILFLIGIVLFRSFHNDSYRHIEKEQFRRIDYFKNLYKLKRNGINFSMMVAERILNEIVIKENRIQINYQDSVTIRLFSDEQNLALYYTIPSVEISGDENLSVDIFLKQLSYISNFEISLWIKHKEGYLRAASSVIDDYSSGMYHSDNDFILEIESGKKVLRSEIDQYGNVLLKFIPLYKSGQVNGFFRIKVFDPYITSSNVSMLNPDGSYCILNNDATPYFESFTDEPPENLKAIYNEMVSGKGSDKSFKEGDYTCFYSYYAQEGLTFGIISKTDDLYDEFKSYQQSLIFVLLSGLILILIIFFVFYYLDIKRREIFNKKLTSILLPDVSIKIANEQEVFHHYSNFFSEINTYIEQLKDGNYNVEFTFIPEDIPIRNNLKRIHYDLMEKTKSEKQREIENEFQNNLNKGSAEIIEVLQYFSELDELSFKIVKSISEFLDFIQGALFILNEIPNKEPYLEMSASYAYGKQRFSQKIIPISEGLIGRAFYEKESIYMTDLPKDYNFIESGFGEQLPAALLIIPLIFNNKVQAVAEFASISPIEEYKIKFIEQIGENIASTIANIKHTLQTEELLEKTRIQSLEIEEQRKTLEEKINTHRNQNRKLDKEILQLIEIIESVKSITYMIEYDLEGVVVDVSGKTMELLGAKRQDILMLHHSKLFNDPNYEETYKEFWNLLLNNKPQSLEETLVYNEKSYKLLQNYVPIRNVKRKIYRFLSVGTLINN